MGVLNVSRAQLVLDGKKYIDDVYKRKTLELSPPGDFSEIRFDGFGGLGMHECETPEYKDLFKYLGSVSQRAVEDTYSCTPVMTEAVAASLDTLNHVVSQAAAPAGHPTSSGAPAM